MLIYYIMNIPTTFDKFSTTTLHVTQPEIQQRFRPQYLSYSGQNDHQQYFLLLIHVVGRAEKSHLCRLLSITSSLSAYTHDLNWACKWPVALQFLDIKGYDTY